MSSKERREAPRTMTDLVLELFGPDGHLVAGVGRLRDISAKGVRIDSDMTLEVGQEVRAHVRRKEQVLLDLACRVVWCRSKASRKVFGLEFLDLSASDLAQIQTWVQTPL